MAKNTAFDLFLALSILAILLGIAIIIFIQIDRGYVVSGVPGDATYERQQHRLVEYLASESKVRSQEVTPSATTQAGVQAEPQNPASAFDPTPLLHTLRLETSEVSAPQPEPSATTAQVQASLEDYEFYWLSQNPWSPNYQPPTEP